MTDDQNRIFWATRIALMVLTVVCFYWAVLVAAFSVLASLSAFGHSWPDGTACAGMFISCSFAAWQILAGQRGALLRIAIYYGVFNLAAGLMFLCEFFVLSSGYSVVHNVYIITGIIWSAVGLPLVVGSAARYWLLQWPGEL